MNLSITLEHRFLSTPDGRLWTQTMFPYGFWERYLAVFDQVNIVARSLNVPSVPEDWKRSDGKGVTFTPIPYFVGPLQYLTRARAVGKAVRRAIGNQDAVIMRVGSRLAVCLEPRLNRERRPFGVEVVCDPYDVFAPGSVHHPLRLLFRWWSPRQLRRQCQNACAAAYVTENALQRRYPPGKVTFNAYYSDVELPLEAFIKKPRIFSDLVETTIISVGTMEQMYKAQDVLINAAAICLRNRVQLRVLFVGDGKHRAELESLAMMNDLKDRVEFLGQLPAGEAVREQLDGADLFVLPSHQEGLPRAMIEAMARGLPCIGSSVGGIPELLEDTELIPAGDAVALASKIREVAIDSHRMTRLSARNLEKAREYSDDVLREKRTQFYHHVREATEVWLKLQG